ncbi:hypothetical protein IE81DRAFT_319224 [Ceraceosorus guamensis]|uniref:Uncharacterized protein n=1 Tax=Ceraceosorus guamensis TaxID=1522189 RepID=A0A316WGT5_9BASI|nr:hypothetical protein IE81DRAFT_319224 [Ceraceosorus guamensis]PWN46325.1 hypothetical protein IE81DRAFT_319224 [Ceraceosorus guamensis]
MRATSGLVLLLLLAHSSSGTKPAHHPRRAEQVSPASQCQSSCCLSQVLGQQHLRRRDPNDHCWHQGQLWFYALKLRGEREAMQARLRSTKQARKDVLLGQCDSACTSLHLRSGARKLALGCDGTPAVPLEDEAAPQAWRERFPFKTGTCWVDAGPGAELSAVRRTADVNDVFRGDEVSTWRAVNAMLSFKQACEEAKGYFVNPAFAAW